MKGVFVMLVGFCFVACSPATEVARVTLLVESARPPSTVVTTDLGYSVELEEAWMVVSNLEFTIAGELHTSSGFERWRGFWLGTAQAHPGHFEGGEVTGRLEGRFVIDLLGGGQALGSATLLAGNYEGMNFTFERGGVVDGLDDTKALFGHTALLRGRASKEHDSIRFRLALDSPQGRRLVGVPFVQHLGPHSTGVIRLRFELEDALEGDTFFDGIEFAALDRTEDGLVWIDAQATEESVVASYNRLLRTLQTHDHFGLEAEIVEIRE